MCATLATFNTKFENDYKRNGQVVQILEMQKVGNEKRYKIKFSDGYIIDNVYENELENIVW